MFGKGAAKRDVQPKPRLQHGPKGGAFCLTVMNGIVVGDPGIEPGVRLREGVTVPCHTLRPVAHWRLDYLWVWGASTSKSNDFA
ncbi:hypothetical protein DSW25_09885 [Sulfitobacter donghicola DSW-25 = KCTC 12864 = JCM 14565]|uniref:Uncharacterized protein n=1 Tax=Sulfitobacter donghicola DSW-25 = KCTC 12864 = JCM 14565 TaxID=1300350 RepID=A0A073IIR5_9RHOB|nr:hypothetical protein DSW25_09885 [Sulfitobacter donghicola DSW-25 = KCTC 12864 = JCM 14565]